MTRFSKLRLASALAATAICAWSATASAQAAKAEESGLKFGAFRLVPVLSIQAVYDTNVNNRPKDTLNIGTGLKAAEAQADMIFKINGGFRLTYPSKKLAAMLAGSVGYDAYTGLSETTVTVANPNKVAATDPDTVNKKIKTSDLSDLNASAQLGLNVFPEGMISLGIRDQFFYTNQPETNPTAFNLMSRINNRATADVRYQPGGGKSTMKFALRYTFGVDQYIENLFKNLNKQTHDIQLHGEYFFLPRTAVFGVIGFQMQQYPDFAKGGLSQFSPEAMPIRIDAGIIGQLSKTVAVNGSVNFQHTNSKNLTSYTLPGGRAEVTWQPLDRTQVQFGFHREANVTSLYGYAASNMIYLNARQWLLKDKLRLGLSATVDLMQFGDPSSKLKKALDAASLAFQQQSDATLTAVDPTKPRFLVDSGRFDTVIGVSPFLRYIVTRWFNASLQYKLTMRTSNGALSTPSGADAMFENKFAMDKHEVMLTATFTY